MAKKSINVDEILKYYIPTSAPSVGTDEYTKSGNKFVILNNGNFTDSDLKNNIATLANNFKNNSGFNSSAYNSYTSLQKSEIFYNKGYKYTFS
jgi:hypothetical protein